MPDPFKVKGGASGADPFSVTHAKKKKGSHGILGAVEKTASGFAHKAAGVGPGIVQVGKLLEQGSVAALTNDQKKLDENAAQIKALGRGAVSQTKNDFLHPHGDFSGAILDTLMLAAPVTRVAAGGKALATGEGVSAARKATFAKHVPEPRTIKVPGTKETVNAGTYSRAASSRAVQKGLEKLRETHPNVRFGLRNQHQRIGHERAINQRYEERIANFNNKALLAKSKKLGKAQQFAIQIVNEKVPVATRVADAKQMLSEATDPRVQKMLGNHLKILQQSKKYVHDVNGMPRIKPAHTNLVDVYEHTRAVANKRDEELIAAGLLRATTAEGAKSRVSQYFNPQVVSPPLFHGTPHAFADFSPGRVGKHDLGGEGAYGPGYYFTENPGVASTYAQHEIETKVFPDSEKSNAFIDRLKKRGGRAQETVRLPDGTYEVYFRGPKSRPNVKIAHLRLRKPFDVDVGDNAAYYDDLTRRLGSKAAASKELQRQGYDGIKHTGGDVVGDGSVRHQVWVAFKPDQVSHGFPDHHFNAGHVPEVLKSDFFISYRNTKNPKKLTEPPQIGNGAQIGVPRQLSELSHQFTGKSIATGNVNPKAVERVAVDSQRANKVLAVWRQRDELKGLATDTKLTEHHIPIRPIWLKNKKWPAEIRDAIDELQRDLTPDEELSVGRRLQDYVFPEKSASVGARVAGIKWVDRRYLGDLNIPKTLGAGEKIGRVADRVNGPFRALTLLKPGYVPPNLVNNLFLNVIHQGFAAPKNLARASRIDHSLGTDGAAMVDAIMGEGKTASIGPAGGLGQKLNEGTSKLQRGLGRLVDVVPRRAAFYEEAKRAGYESDQDVLRLLTDAAHKDDLIRVGREANSEIIDFSNLGPAEQALVRRIIFLYPWVKGATMYGGRFLKEHPVKAGTFGQIGTQGNDFVDRTLGAMPSYGLGLVGVGKNLVENTGAFNNFPQATQELEVVVGLLRKNPAKAAQILSQASPTVKAVLSGSQGVSSLDSLSGASLIRLGRELYNPNTDPKKVYKESRRDALLRIFLGGAAPRELNVPAAHKQAKLGR